jgi:uncharacterized protein (DUF58 family)
MDTHSTIIAPKPGVYCTLRELSEYARQNKKHTLHLRRKSQSVGGFGRRSSVRGRGMEFLESRPYVASDEIRHIDWRVSARLNGVFTKIYIEEKNRPIFVVVDARETMFFGTKTCLKSVLAARLASHIAAAAINGGDNLAGFVLGRDGDIECAPGHDHRALARFLGALASATYKLYDQRGNESGLTTWTAVLTRLTRKVPAGSAIFLISDFSDLALENKSSLFTLRKRADIFALRTSDPLEDHLPAIGRAGITFGGDELELNTEDAGLKKSYATARHQQKAEQNAFLQSLGIVLLDFCTVDGNNIDLKPLFSGSW